MIGLILILLAVLILPFTVKIIEHNLEYFLFAMGLLATLASGSLSSHLVLEILGNKLLYFISLAVLGAGLLFLLLKDRLKAMVDGILSKVPLRFFVFLLVALLGFASSFLTAIIAALILVEIVNLLPLDRPRKLRLIVYACFAIGLGAVLTPVGEPLSTIVVSRLHGDFWYLARLIGIDVVPGVLLLAVLASATTRKGKPSRTPVPQLDEDELYFLDSEEEGGAETIREVFVRSFKIFVFVFALELLGAGFKPLIDQYILQLDSRLLYLINMLSAVLDNATLASAEVSTGMTTLQIKSVLIGLLISGGMLIPGNIPNIISAHKLGLESKEWAKVGVPVGLCLLSIYFIALFLI